MEPRRAEIRHLYVSPGHNFFGRHGELPDTHPAIEVPRMVCLAGRGVEGDRYCDFKPDYKGQITFFDAAVYRRLEQELGLAPIHPAASRRNVILSGVDLNDLVGHWFRLGGIRFEGTEECRPCCWMDKAVGAGAEAALRGWGGLRARILDDGQLTTGPTELTVEA